MKLLGREHSILELSAVQMRKLRLDDVETVIRL
jgi:hypothetical protein